MKKAISPQSLAIIKRMQQSELTESYIYEEIARFAKGEEKSKISWYKLMARVMGFTFAIKMMENGENASQEEYMLLAGEAEESILIRQQVEEHENSLLVMLDEERLQYVGGSVK